MNLAGAEPTNESINESSNGLTKDWIKGWVESPLGKVPQVNTILSRRDIWGAWKNRWGINRMGFRVNPGLYAVGSPDENSPVVVSANYKLSFDQLRKNLTGWNVWILVLDTKGINVWCAAGKGTFGTNELINRINMVKLNQVVKHRNLILPQLGAPGVSAHMVAKFAGFRVIYGPIRAEDLISFLENGLKATKEMREVHFTLKDRAVLVPIEIVHGAIPLAIILLILVLLSVVPPDGPGGLVKILSGALTAFIPFLGGAITGIILMPLILPWIPGRAFSWKGWLLGFIWATYVNFAPLTFPDWLSSAAVFLIIPAFSAYFALNFTGSTPYTSLSGVKKEMKIAVPLIIASAGLGTLFIVINKIREFLPA